MKRARPADWLLIWLTKRVNARGGYVSSGRPIRDDEIGGTGRRELLYDPTLAQYRIPGPARD